MQVLLRLLNGNSNAVFIRPIVYRNNRNPPKVAAWRPNLLKKRTYHTNHGDGIRCRKHQAYEISVRPVFLKDERNLFKGRIRKEKTQSEEKEEQGSVFGAVALIVGTSIGSGILALPLKTAHAGFIPTASIMIACWLFLLLEALLLAEVNVALMKRMENDGRKRAVDRKMEVISFTTMAEATVGKFGANLATMGYVFLAYSSMVAYTAKSGDILSHLCVYPSLTLGCGFTIIFTLLISVGGMKLTNQVNQGLTVLMIGLLIFIEVTLVSSGAWHGITGIGNWTRTPETLPVIIFSLVYHDLSPVLCAYLGGDISRIRMSVVLGSLVPLIILLVWEALALGVSPGLDGTDPVDWLMGGSELSLIVETFSLLAVGTSLIGTLLGLSQFFTEQLSQFEYTKKSNIGFLGLEGWWESSRVHLASMVLAVAPPMFVATAIPDAFSTATDVAGGYFMTMLFGVFPPAMAWSLFGSMAKPDNDSENELNVNTAKYGGEGTAMPDRMMFQNALKKKPALIGIGLSACGVILEQLLQDLSLFH